MVLVKKRHFSNFSWREYRPGKYPLRYSKTKIPPFKPIKSRSSKNRKIDILNLTLTLSLTLTITLNYNPNHNPNIHPGEKATLAQNPCIIWHFLTGPHVFSTKSVTPETVWSRGTLISHPESPTSSKMAKNEKNVEKWTNPAKSDP